MAEERKQQRHLTEGGSTQEEAAAACSEADDAFCATKKLVQDLPSLGGTCVEINKRRIVLFRVPRERLQKEQEAKSAALFERSAVFAMDAICYHMGGPLENGDIEELGNKLVAVCPWHHYKITLDTGEGMYEASPRQWKSKGPRQRTHTVRIDQRTGAIAVRLDLHGDTLASDEYAVRYSKQKYTGSGVRVHSKLERARPS